MCLYGEIVICFGFGFEVFCVVGIVNGVNFVFVVVFCYWVIGVDGIFIGFVGGLLCK